MPAGAQQYGPIEDIEVDGRGPVHAPTARGLGDPIEFELIERTKVAALS